MFYLALKIKFAGSFTCSLERNDAIAIPHSTGFPIPRVGGVCQGSLWALLSWAQRQSLKIPRFPK